MSYIVPKLNLNRLPKNCEDYSLTCAKNVKVIDNTIVNFDGIEIAIPNELKILLRVTRLSRGRTARFMDNLKLVGCVPYINTFYILYASHFVGYFPEDEDFVNLYENSVVILDLKKYKEANITNNVIELGEYAYLTAYKYIEGATIEGTVITNSKGDVIIELHQYNKEQTLDVPISFINLSEHKFSNVFDNYKNYHPSFYTQAPVVPIVNFIFKEYADVSVNSGVYSLFIRFKTLHDSYSNWMSCSKPFFIGNHRKTDTQVGSFYYMDSVLLASDYTITFEISAVTVPEYYMDRVVKAEIAYICKTEEEEYAGKLKEIDINFNDACLFTFIPSHANDERININDLLEPIYNLYDVKNAIYKDNTFFASNYKESNLNVNLNIGKDDIVIKSIPYNIVQQDQDNSVIITKLLNSVSDINPEYKTRIQKDDTSYFELLVKNRTRRSCEKTGSLEEFAFLERDTKINKSLSFYFSSEKEAQDYKEDITNYGFGEHANLKEDFRHPYFDDNRVSGTGEIMREAENKKFSVLSRMFDKSLKTISEGGTETVYGIAYYSKEDNNGNIILNEVYDASAYNDNNQPEYGDTSEQIKQENSEIPYIGDIIDDAISKQEDAIVPFDADFCDIPNVEGKFVSVKVVIEGNDYSARIAGNPNTLVIFKKVSIYEEEVNGEYIVKLKFVLRDEFNCLTEFDINIDDIFVTQYRVTYLYYYNNEYYNNRYYKSIHTYRDSGDTKPFNAYADFTKNFDGAAKYDTLKQYAYEGYAGEGYNHEVESLYKSPDDGHLDFIESFGYIDYELNGLKYAYHVDKNGYKKGNRYRYGGYNNFTVEEDKMSWADSRARRIKLYIGIDKHEFTYSASFTTDSGEQKELITSTDKYLDNISTLIPGQVYDFYVHFIKENGETTNGIFIGSKQIPYESDDFNSSSIYVKVPTFKIETSEEIVNTYPYHYYSFCKKQKQVATGIKPNVSDCYDVVEMDLFLFSRFKEKAIIDSDKSEEFGQYYPSSDTSNVDTFGNSGKYILDSTIQNTRMFLESDKYYDSSILYRLSPYIKTELVCSYDCTDDIFSSINDIFLDGYICKIYKPLNDFVDTLWMDSTYYQKLSDNKLVTSLEDIFDAGEGLIINYDDDGYASNPVLDFNGGRFYLETSSGYIYNPDEVTKLLKSTDTITSEIYPSDTTIDIEDDFVYKRSKIGLIYSNYNLNFLRLREDLVQSPKSIKLKVPYVVKKNASGEYEVFYNYIYKSISIYKIAGTTLDSCYKTIPFYRDFTQLTYSPYDKQYSNYVYNTTIRKTERLGDSIKWNIPRFKSTYFYNLDANKGNIVNLVASGKSIIIHTEKGMFAFETNSKLVSNNGEINVENTEVFDIDPIDIVGSENGYAGLQEKHHAAACFDGYVFADVSSNDLFIYNSGGLVNITDNIKHLLEFFTIVDFAAAGIQKYGICLCCVTLASKVDKEFVATINLSYNFAKNAFISLHDFKFNKGYFNSINTIFEHGVIEKDNSVDYTTMNFSEPFTTVPAVAKIPKDDTIYPTIVTIDNNIEYNNSYIDVIVVNNFELVKVLDFINWCLTIPKDFVADAAVDEGSNTADVYYNCDLYHMKRDIEPASSETDPYNKENAKSILIYSDSAVTDEISLNTSSNDKALDTTENYEKVRYNAGVWSINYFRNIKSKDEQEKTLIYGKYFVVRFVFNPKRFKFEALTLKLNKYV